MRLALCFLLAGCAVPTTGPVTADPSEDGADDKADGYRLADVQCAGTPDAGPARSLRHFSSRVITAAGGAHHRGIDLLATADDDVQTIRGDISYTIFDKALEDEDVDVFACRQHAWVRIGTVRTDDEGHFTLPLSDEERLPLGMRDMFVSVVGDRTGTRFLAVVAPADIELAVSDVDGTLTTGENDFAAAVFGIQADIQPGAAAGWQHVVSTGRIPVYVTARARMFTEDTRTWLADTGMPRGALRLAPHLLLPGDSTVAYKADTLEALALPLGIGVGNRATDIDAYSTAGLTPAQIFIKLPEFSDEVAPYLTAGDAIGFDMYPGPL